MVPNLTVWVLLIKRLNIFVWGGYVGGGGGGDITTTMTMKAEGTAVYVSLYITALYVVTRGGLIQAYIHASIHRF